MEITSSLVFPVTDGQIEAFSAWAQNKYGTYNSYLGACKSPAIDTYIRTHILPIEMKSVLRETEPYVGVNAVDIHIGRLQMYRKRILDKIKYMKGKLGKLAFPVEASEIRIVRRDAIIRRRQAIETIVARQHQYFAEYAEAVRLGLDFPPDINPVILPVTIVQKRLTKEEAETRVMDDDCVICLSMHKMMDACTTNCGHQFGRACLTKWSKIGPRCHNGGAYKCPLCRTSIVEITEFVFDEPTDNVV